MDWIQILLTAVFVFLLGLFLKHYFPSYMEEKAKNLATKEDVEEITRKTEEIQKEFREGFELFSSDVHFKYDFFYKQYSELYCGLYATIMQSEYVRHFIHANEGKIITFEEAPFLEISPTTRVTQRLKWGSGEPTQVSKETEKFDTPLSQDNKMKMCNNIIEHSDLASPKLLKIAMSYRFAFNYYDGNRDGKKSAFSATANEEEFRLIREMVICIVSDYNKLRKELKMAYNQDELDTGIPKLNI